MTGNREDGGSHAARSKSAFFSAISSLKEAGSHAVEGIKQFTDNVVIELDQVSDTLEAELNAKLVRNAEKYGRDHESRALQQGETPEVAARIRNYLVRNHPVHSLHTPSNDKGGPSGPGPGAGAVG